MIAAIVSPGCVAEISAWGLAEMMHNTAPQVRREMQTGRSAVGVDLLGAEVDLGEETVPEMIDADTLQAMLQGQDYHMMETEIEALLFKAKADAKLKERRRIREITDQARDLPEIQLRCARGMRRRSSRGGSGSDATDSRLTYF